jgi:agmatinase
METGTEVYEEGLFTLPELSLEVPPAIMAEKVKKAVGDLLSEGKFPVILGGEHSVTPPAVEAFASKYDKLSVLQFDAHADLRDEYMGSRFNHACTGARLAGICSLVQAGIRSMSKEEKDHPRVKRFFSARDIISGDTSPADISGELSENVYVTIDLDVLDPSVMPSTGTPEPGGLDWYLLTSILKAVASEHKVVGFDVVELCPSPHNRAPDFTAAKLVYKFLSYIYSNM